MRFLLRRKALAAVAILTMALAIGANTAALSVLKAFLLSSLAIPDVDRVVAVYPERELPGRGAVQFNDAYPNYLLLRQLQHSFVDVGVFLQLSASWDDHGDARQLSAARVSANFLSTLRVTPFLGRNFTAQEEGPSPAPVILISHALWANALGSSPDVVGRTLAINGAPHTVIGVLPPGFSQPALTDVWLPFDIPLDQRTRVNGARQLSMFARLNTGTSLEVARKDMASFTVRAIEASADNKDYRYSAKTLRDLLLGGADSSVLFVLAGAGGLLLLAILNLSSLLLAWGFERRQEFAVRIALGAGTRQVIRLMLEQSLVIVAMGAALGIAFSILALRLLQGFDLGVTVTPFVHAARLDVSVLAVSVLLTLVAGVAAGALPMWFVRDVGIADTIRSASRTATVSRSAMAWQKGVVFAQASLSVVILAAAVLIGVSFYRLSAVPNGFDAGRKIVARVVLPEPKYAAHPARAAFARALSDNLAHDAELLSSGFSTTLPVSDVPWGGRFHIELPDGSLSPEPALLHFRRISPSYFGAMNIPVLRGRTFTAQDDTAAVQVAIVSGALANRLWPNEDAVGKRLVRAASGNIKPLPLMIVGVVGNTMDGGYGAPPGETVYVPYSQISNTRLSIVAEGRGSAAQTVAAIRRALRAADPVVAAGQIATLDGLVLQANALPRLRTILVLIFAIIAVGIVSLGSYGVMSQLVSTRERELALRLVLGARPAALGRSVITQVARITLPGVAVGLLAMWLLSGALKTFVFGVAATSPIVLAASGALLIVITLMATLPCAVRATRVDVRSGMEA